MRVTLIGIPGSGKTTLAQTLSGMFNCMHISSGALARAYGFAGSAAESTGQLDPDEDKIRWLVKEAVGNSNHYILDGFPRMVDQVENVDVRIDTAIYLAMYDEQIAIDRLLKRGRPDDTTDIINSRIETYYKHTYPLISYFIDKGKLLHIDASGPMSHTLAQAVGKMSDIGILEATDYIDKLMRAYNDPRNNEKGSMGQGK